MSKLTPDDNAYHLQYDTPAIRSGAIQFVKCSNCGVEPGTPCLLLFYGPMRGQPLEGFAHAARRIEYHEWQDVYGPATAAPPAPEPVVHRSVITADPCWNPRQHCASCTQCTCGVPLSEHTTPPPVASAGLKSSSDVDDLLG